jgi:hypothetical protein
MPRPFALCACVVSVLLAASMPAQHADPFGLLAALPAMQAVERGVRVVVRDEQGQPVPDAVLVVVPTSGPDYSAAWIPAGAAYPGDAINQLAHVCAAAGGQRFVLDERGGTQLPRVSGYAFAWRDGTFAAKSYVVEQGRPVPRVELELALPYTCTAMVVDAQGRSAAGVSVAVTNGNQRATTDANGVAAFRMQKSRVTEQSRLRLVVASNESIEVPMPASGGEARLQLPECGRVHATYTGSLLPGSTLSWSLRQGDRRMTPDLQGERDATFNFVQVGYEGDLQVVADSSTTTASVDGVTAGATIERTLARKAGERCVVVRPLSPDGAPVENGYVDANWEFRNGSSSSGATTNAAGWLEVAVPDRAETAKVRLLLHRGGWNGPIVGSLEVAVEAADTGRIERGEVRVTPPKVALAGEVVDTAGRPLRGVNLRVSGPTSVQVESNADGRFEIALPESPPADLGLELAGNGWFFVDPPATSRVFPTGVPARVVLQAAGRLRFAAAGLIPGVRHDFRAHVVSAAGDGLRVDVPLALDREFLLLPAGHWHFVVTRGEAEVYRLDDVRVDAGIEVHDPRFMAFDWRAFAVLLVVHVEDATGAPTDACTVWIRTRNMGHGTRPTKGIARWLVNEGGGTVEVEPRDKKLPKIDLGAATGEQWVRLGAGPRLEVRVEPAPKLPDTARLVARVDGRTEPLGLDATGKGVVWLDRIGDRSVQLAVVVGDTTHELPNRKREVDVAAGGAVLTFSGDAGLQAAIDTLVGR